MINKLKIWIGLSLLSIYVGLFAYLAVYSVPAGDDYVHYNFFRSASGFIDSLIGFWSGWNGRFTTMFIIQLSNSLGIMDNYYLHTFLAIALSMFSLYFIVASLFGDIATPTKVFIALLLQSIWLAVAIDLNQTLYWLAGVNYYWTCSVLLIEFALIVNIYKGKNVKIYACLLGVLVFLNSGASELSAAYQVPVFAGAALITAASGSAKCSKCMLLILCIALAGVGLHIINPGNSARVSSGVLAFLGPNPIPTSGSVLIAYRVGILAGLSSSYRFFTRPIIYVLLLFLPIVSDNVKQPKFVDKMPFEFKIWHICLFQILTVCCFQAVGGYAMGNSLYTRSMATVRWVMLAQWVLFFVFLYRNTKFIEWIRNIRIYRYKEIILLICLLMSTNFSLLRADYGIASDYSRQVTERKEFIKEQSALGRKNLIVPTINASPRLFIRDVIPSRKILRDYAYYYGLNSIEEKSPLFIEAMVEGRNSDDDEVKLLFVKADAGDEEAVLFFKSINGDEEAGIKLLILKAEQGDSDAQFTLAKYYDTSDNLISPYIQKNDELALKYYFKLAERGNRQAQDLLWTFYLGGIRTDRDLDVIIWGLKLVLNPF